jgi:gamma-glutamylcyclotransferase (GGCT)/AIG2-like uncharacterized protein YtfP
MAMERRIPCFAYGSNMDLDQMTQRCPSARFFSVARLADHRLAFTRFSTNRQSGVADAVPAPGHEVWGVVYEITPQDLERLDRFEGYRPNRLPHENAYNRDERELQLADREIGTSRVMVYLATRQANASLPNQEYKRLIVSGARHWGLPAHYLAELERIEVQP